MKPWNGCHQQHVCTCTALIIARPLVNSRVYCSPSKRYLGLCTCTYYECNNHGMSLLPCHFTKLNNTINWNFHSRTVSDRHQHHIWKSKHSSPSLWATVKYKFPYNGHRQIGVSLSEPHTDEQSVCMLCMRVRFYTYYKSRICQIDVKCMRKTKCTGQCDSCFERQRKQTELEFPDKQRRKLQQRRETDQEQGSQQQERSPHR